MFHDMLGMEYSGGLQPGLGRTVLAGRYLPGWGSTESALFAQSQVSKGWSSYRPGPGAGPGQLPAGGDPGLGGRPGGPHR